MSVEKLVCTGAVALSIVAVAKTIPASAADLYRSYRDTHIPALMWQGFYFGANVGTAMTNINPNSNVVFLGETPGVVFTDKSVDSSELFGGIQAGYNFQSGSFLYGAELDLGRMDNSSSRTFADPVISARSLKIKGEAGWYGDVTGRVGYTWDNLLIYGKGGLAWFTGNVKATDSFDNISNDSGTFVGWTAGGGFEYMISPNWTLKFEYMYFDFGNNNFDCCFGAPNTAGFDNELTSNTVKVGFNYLLNSQQAPLK